MVSALVFAAGLLAQAAPDYSDHQPTASERLSCALVGPAGRRARFDLDIDGVGADRRFRLRAQPGAAWVSGMTASGIEPPSADPTYASDEQLIFVAGGVPYVLILGFEGVGAVQLAEAELYENRHGNPSLNRQIAAGLCVGRSTAAAIPDSRPLPRAPRVPLDPYHGEAQALSLSYRVRCRLVRLDLSETSFDMAVRISQEPGVEPGEGKGMLSLERASRGAWPPEPVSVNGKVYAALTVPEAAPSGAFPGALVTVNRESGETRFTMLYLIERPPPFPNWLRVDDAEVFLDAPSMIGSGVCEPVAS